VASSFGASLGTEDAAAAAVVEDCFEDDEEEEEMVLEGLVEDERLDRFEEEEDEEVEPTTVEGAESAM